MLVAARTQREPALANAGGHAAHLPLVAAIRSPSPVRTTPIALLQRRNMALWTALLAGVDSCPPPLSSRAQAVAEYLAEHGASFFDELSDGTRLLRTQVEEALAELVAFGLVNADSFSGLRALLVPADKRPSAHGRRSHRGSLFRMEDAGRWALRPGAAPAFRPGARQAPGPGLSQADRRDAPGNDAIEHIARTLLKRYGVVFWRLLEREADWLPPWRDLLRVYHRLEARGEVRGGRFVEGVSGEQFALPEAVGLLRKVRRAELVGAMICVTGVDPLNLVGSVIPGQKVPALSGSRVLFRDGVPLASLVSREVTFFESMPAAEEWSAKNILLRGHARAVVATSV